MVHMHIPRVHGFSGSAGAISFFSRLDLMCMFDCCMVCKSVRYVGRPCMCKDWHVSTNGEGVGLMVHVGEDREMLLNDIGIIGMSITGGGFFQSGNGPMTISCCSRGPALATASKSFPFFGNGFTNNDSS